MKKIKMILVFLLLLCGCQSPTNHQDPITNEKVLTQINPYVIKSDILSFLTQEDQDYFHQLLDAVFKQEKDIELSSDYDANLRVLSALSNNPYYYFVKNITFPLFLFTLI